MEKCKCNKDIYLMLEGWRHHDDGKFCEAKNGKIQHARPLLVSVDVETSGPYPPKFSMLSIGAVLVENDVDLPNRFYTEIQPLNTNFIGKAMEVNGLDLVKLKEAPRAKEAMSKFDLWLRNLHGHGLVFFSDNPGFDWQFINYYFQEFLGRNPFGHSSKDIGSLYKGTQRDLRVNFKWLRRTKHTHNALDDALGNAEALSSIIRSCNINGVYQ